VKNDETQSKTMQSYEKTMKHYEKYAKPGPAMKNDNKLCNFPVLPHLAFPILLLQYDGSATH
jgi:hypothetical protein